MEKELQLSQLAKLAEISTDFSRLGDEYMFLRIKPVTGSATKMLETLRFEGLAFLLCRGGRFSLDINLAPHTITAGTLLCVPPQSVLTPREVDSLDADMLILSTDFMRSIAIDLNTWASSGIPFRQPGNDTIHLAADERSMIEKYFDLFHLNTVVNKDQTYVRSIARTLLAAIIYQLMQFMTERIDDTSSQPYSRRISYVQDFRRLVHENFRSERSVGFYAEKLFISPKYLSLIIKEVTGKSAAAWIDECVILEAKNLLKFSGKNVQQVAYELNFNNQSSFGKYFKHLTGMSPTQFQRS